MAWQCGEREPATSRRLAWVRVAVILVGWAAGLAEAARLSPARLWEFPVAAAIFLAGTSFLSVLLPGGHRLTGTLLAVLPLAAVLRAGGLVLPVLAVGLGYRTLRGEMRAVPYLYNVAQLTLSSLAGGRVYHWLEGGGPHPPMPQMLAMACLGVAAYQAVNTFLVTLWRSGEDPRGFGQLFVAVLTSERHYPVLALYSLAPVTSLLLTDAYGYWGLATAVASFMPVPHLLAAYGQLRTTQQRLVIDELTQVFNYRYFADWLRLQAPEFARSGRPVAMLVVDVDDLKAINDRYGHAAGNAVVRDLAGRLRQLLRAEDAIVRFGGDEFIALLPGVRGPEAARIAERLREELREAAAMDPDAGEVRYSVSVGHAAFPDDTRDVDDLFRLADERMYGEKRGER